MKDLFLVGQQPLLHMLNGFRHLATQKISVVSENIITRASENRLCNTSRELYKNGLKLQNMDTKFN